MSGRNRGRSLLSSTLRWLSGDVGHLAVWLCRPGILDIPLQPDYAPGAGPGACNPAQHVRSLGSEVGAASIPRGGALKRGASYADAEHHNSMDANGVGAGATIRGRLLQEFRGGGG